MGQKPSKKALSPTRRPSDQPPPIPERRPSNNQPMADRSNNPTIADRRPSANQAAENLSVFKKTTPTHLVNHTRRPSSNVEDSADKSESQDGKKMGNHGDGRGGIQKNKSSGESREDANEGNSGGNKSENAGGKKGNPGEIEVKPKRQNLFDHMIAFYFRNDNERLMGGDVDVDGICDWAMMNGVEALNDKLRAKYGEDLDSFLMNAAIQKEEEYEEEEEEEEEESVEETPTAAEIHHDATMDRPAMPVTRRRPTNQMHFTLDENGNVNVPESQQMDHAAPIDLRTQLDQFIQDNDASKSAELDRLVKFASAHGLVALNSELMVMFGKDLKGNEMQAPREHQAMNIKKFGVGFDSEVINEMAGHKLHHESSDGAMILDSEGVCSRFRLDTQSSVFGMCKCGHDRAAHVSKRNSGGGAALGTLQKKLAARRASINMDEENMRRMKEAQKTMTEMPVPDFKPAPPSARAGSIVPPEVKPLVVRAGSIVPPDTKPPPPRASKLGSMMDNGKSTATSLPATTPESKPPAPPRSSSIVPPDTKSPPPHASQLGTMMDIKPTDVKPATPQKSMVSPESVKAAPPPSKSAARPKSATRPKSTRRSKNIGSAIPNGTERLGGSAQGGKLPEACYTSTFQLDMGAAEFGMCAICGWKKSEHKEKVDDVKTTPSRPMSIRKNGPNEPCGNYKLDLNAESFGACSCGFSKRAHSGQEGNQQTVSKTLERRWQNMKEVV